VVWYVGVEDEDGVLSERGGSASAMKPGGRTRAEPSSLVPICSQEAQ
jgi:hypothetical protein